ncbi:MAG: hypothetical protein KKA44_08220 [Alphaproteobacteria bacterium]|nr:hypothetical protein [Alphaproteobacteria bacterium]MBU0865524.1 hypothetical protein [Alphaproteobacteria bacterium]MBU1824946.1 hypothetical protein [Alphaproteobacteria bacterium]
MKRTMIAVSGAAMLALGGGAASAAPAVADGYDWTMRINEDRVSDAILAYEVDGTDDQPLNFRCEQGGNRIFAGISGGAPDLTAIELASGSAKLRITGETEIDEMPFFQSQEIAGGSPLIRAFASSGWLRMTANDRTIDMAATATGKQAIARFIEFCTR